MTQALRRLKCAYRHCGRAIPPDRIASAQYCSNRCKVREYRLRHPEVLRNEKSRKRGPRPRSKEADEANKKRDRERFREYRQRYKYWECYNSEANRTLKTLLRNLGVSFETDKLKDYTEEFLMRAIEDGKKKMLSFFHPFSHNRYTKHLSIRYPERATAKLQRVCANIKRGADKAKKIVRNRNVDNRRHPFFKGR